MNIGTHPIGAGHPCYVIAEIGGNHDGNLNQALELIDTAALCGADCAKFQLFNPDRLYPGRHTPGAVPPQWLETLKDRCQTAGVDFLCSVFSSFDLGIYLSVEPAAVKIASPESHNLELIRLAIATSLPVIISTGASYMADVEAIPITSTVILLHCVSAYPAVDEELNLHAMVAMADRLDVDAVGLSDHTLGWLGSAAAVALGASVIEKHLTPDRTRPGPDHGYALEPAEFADMVAAIRQVELMLGDGIKRPTVSEDPTDRRAAA